MLKITGTDNHRIVEDDFNPRIYSEEWTCTTCKEWFDAENILWLADDNTLSTIYGKPYCEACCPEQY